MTFIEPHTDFDFSFDESLSQEQLQDLVQAVGATTLRLFIKLIVDESANPVLSLAQVGYAVGLYSDAKGTELARKFGISKQAFCQGAAKWQEKLNLRKSSNQRGHNGRAQMKMAYRLDRARKQALWKRNSH